MTSDSNVHPKRISRRKFIQLGALTGTAMAVSGCTINLQRSETIEPYVIPPEESLPGENVWYATTCRMCSAGCGIIVRVSNGRARKIEGNPLHPLNAGKTCARGQAGLQYLYNPDRLRNAVRNEARGSGSGSTDPFGKRYGLKATAIYWDEAIDELASRIGSARPGAVAFYGSQIDDGLGAVVAPFLQALGAPAPVFYDNEGAYAGRSTLARLTGQYFGAGPALPFFHLSTSDIVYSFGANLLDGGLSMVAYSRSFGEMRGGALGKRGYLVQFEPRLSATGAVADEWIPIPPGTEGQVALAIGRIMIDEGLGNAANSPVAGLFAGADVGGAASLSGLGEARLGEPVGVADQLVDDVGLGCVERDRVVADVLRRAEGPLRQRPVEGAGRHQPGDRADAPAGQSVEPGRHLTELRHPVGREVEPIGTVPVGGDGEPLVQHRQLGRDRPPQGVLLRRVAHRLDRVARHVRLADRRDVGPAATIGQVLGPRVVVGERRRGRFGSGVHGRLRVERPTMVGAGRTLVDPPVPGAAVLRREASDRQSS